MPSASGGDEEEGIAAWLDSNIRGERAAVPSSFKYDNAAGVSSSSWPQIDRIVLPLMKRLIVNPDVRIQYRQMSGWNADDTIVGWVDKDTQMCRHSVNCPLVQNHWPWFKSDETGETEFCGPRFGVQCPLDALFEMVGSNQHRALHLDKIELIAEGKLLLDKIAGTVRRPVKPDLHIFHTKGESRGSYGWHFDDTDVLIYMLEGTKRFRVAGTEMESPTVVDINMTPGDAVFIPAKFYHHGMGTGVNSTVLSLAFSPTTRNDDNDNKSAVDDCIALAAIVAALAALYYCASVIIFQRKKKKRKGRRPPLPPPRPSSSSDNNNNVASGSSQRRISRAKNKHV